jgi:uncharacterized protein (TIGR02145 family)
MKKVLTILSFLSFSITSIAQNDNVGIGTNIPTSSALLDLSSTTMGFLPPRMDTTQRNAIVSPADGLIIFNTSINSLQLKINAGWVSLITPSSTAVFLPTIVIGTQQWMSKNLDIAFYRNGDPIPHVTDTTAWASLTTGAWCYYNNDSTQGSKYGKLYNWYAVNDLRGLAPQGWHIPNDAEWFTLSSTLGGNTIAGGQIKEAGTLNWPSPNYAGNNNSGFTGLPGGGRNFSGTFFAFGGNGGYWWCSTEFGSTLAWNRNVGYNSGFFFRNNTSKQNGLSVRCLRD